MVNKEKTRHLTREDIHDGVFIKSWVNPFQDTTIGFFNGDYTYSINQFGQIVERDMVKELFPDECLSAYYMIDKADAMTLLRQAHHAFADKSKSKTLFEQAIFERYKFDFNRSIKIVEEIDTNQDCRQVLSELYHNFRNFPKSRYAVTSEMIDWQNQPLNGPRRKIGLIFEDEPLSESAMKELTYKRGNPKNLIFTPTAVPENNITRLLMEQSNHYVLNGTTFEYVKKC